MVVETTLQQLLENLSCDYRAAALAPHPNLDGGIVQVQTTVHSVTENLSCTFALRDEFGEAQAKILASPDQTAAENCHLCYIRSRRAGEDAGDVWDEAVSQGQRKVFAPMPCRKPWIKSGILDTY